MKGDLMKKTELNKIIREKIDELDDTEPMKEFLITILDLERQYIVYQRKQYTKDYIKHATDYSNQQEES